MEGVRVEKEGEEGERRKGERGRKESVGREKMIIFVFEIETIKEV